MRLMFFAIPLILPLIACSSDPEVPKPQPPAPQAVAPEIKIPEPPVPAKEEPKITGLDAKINVAKNLNPDLTGRPSPAVMRLYALKSLGKFQSGDFYKLTNNYEALLGADLVSSEQLFLHPGQNKIIQQTLTPETKYIAVTVAYRDLNQAVWRAAAPIQADKTNLLSITIGKLKVNIQ